MFCVKLRRGQPQLFSFFKTLLTFRSEVNAVFLSDPSPSNPPFIGRLFVCGDVLVSAQSFRIFFFLLGFFFVYFFLFFINMQVQMLLWSLKLTVMCITSTVA